MDLALSPEQRAFREEVRGFLDTMLTPVMRRGAALTSGVFAEPDVYRAWQTALDAQGWLTYFWPASAGGPGWGAVERWIFETECARAGAPILPGMGLKLVGPVLYTYGTPEQQERFLPALRSGEHIWAQGFSEPGSGSDLASLQCRAVRDGDRYILNGSKIWTTHAHHANRMFCLVRTDPDVKKQAGISFLLVDMNQPGISVRPILTVAGDHEVNQVFLEDVVVPTQDLVGDEGQGWTIAKFLLENERGGTGYAPQLLADLDRLVAAASPLGVLLVDRAVRLRLEAEALEMTELRTLLEIEDGQAPAPRSLAVKLIASEIRQGIEALAVDAFGLAGLQLPVERPFHAHEAPPLAGPPEAGLAAARYLNARAWSIFGGTSEIQLNLIARAAPAAP